MERMVVVMRKFMNDDKVKKELFDLVKNNNLNRNKGAFIFNVDDIVKRPSDIKWVSISFFKNDVPIEMEVIDDIKKCGKNNLVLVGYDNENYMSTVTI